MTGKGLILSRKSDEAVHIGEFICVTVIEVRGARARLHIVAPDDTKILRGELLAVATSFDVVDGTAKPVKAGVTP